MCACKTNPILSDNTKPILRNCQAGTRCTVMRQSLYRYQQQSDSESEGREFESLRARQRKASQTRTMWGHAYGPEAIDASSSDSFADLGVKGLSARMSNQGSYRALRTAARRQRACLTFQPVRRFWGVLVGPQSSSARDGRVSRHPCPVRSSRLRSANLNFDIGQLRRGLF